MLTDGDSHTTSAWRTRQDDFPNGILPLRGSVIARATSAVPMQAGLDLGLGGVDPRFNVVELWSAALARGDDAEVDRLVRQSRVDRICAAASGQLGTMLG